MILYKIYFNEVGSITFNVRIIIRAVAEFCANECFYKFAFWDRRFQDTTKAV